MPISEREKRARKEAKIPNRLSPRCNIRIRTDKN